MSKISKCTVIPRAQYGQTRCLDSESSSRIPPAAVIASFSTGVISRCFLLPTPCCCCCCCCCCSSTHTALQVSKWRSSLHTYVHTLVAKITSYLRVECTRGLIFTIMQTKQSASDFGLLERESRNIRHDVKEECSSCKAVELAPFMTGSSKSPLRPLEMYWLLLLLFPRRNSLCKE
jgi:hypothetical protein